jgi:UDPglucose--hexose-1-phosphate uridylyltransferase
MPELRKDPVIGRWVIIATERKKRPTDFGVVAQKLKMDASKCPFCEGNEAQTPPEILAFRDDTPKDSPGWMVRVVPNKFPALAIEGELERTSEGMFERMNGVGAHEVIIETPKHEINHNVLSEVETGLVLRAYHERVINLKGDKRLEYILIFKNKGGDAGASLEHTHSQLIALPIIPKRVTEELNGAKEHFKSKKRCIFCDIIRQELAEGTRVVAENQEFVILSPYAPKSPFETWILPKKHASRFEDLSDEQLPYLSQIMHLLMKKISDTLGDPPYNYIIHTAPLHSDHEYYHWHIEVMPKLTQIAGFEWGSGFHINPTSPEDAAKALRISPGS